MSVPTIPSSSLKISTDKLDRIRDDSLLDTRRSQPNMNRFSQISLSGHRISEEIEEIADTGESTFTNKKSNHLTKNDLD